MNASMFQEYLLKLEEVPKEEMDFLISQSKLVSFKKDESFYVAGDECHSIWFVVEGMAKSLYTKDDGKFFIKNFIMPGSFVAPFYEMVNKIPTRDSIVAKTDVKALQFDFGILDVIMKRHPNWIKMYMKIMQSYYFTKEQREYDFLMLDATERYLNFLDRYKDMTQHLNQHEIASYLGITKTSLSRLVKALKESNQLP